METYTARHLRAIFFVIITNKYYLNKMLQPLDMRQNATPSPRKEKIIIRERHLTAA